MLAGTRSSGGYDAHILKSLLTIEIRQTDWKSNLSLALMLKNVVRLVADGRAKCVCPRQDFSGWSSKICEQGQSLPRKVGEYRLLHSNNLTLLANISDLKKTCLWQMIYLILLSRQRRRKKFWEIGTWRRRSWTSCWRDRCCFPENRRILHLRSLIRFRNWRIRRCSCTLGPKHGAQKRKPSTNSIDWNVAVKGHLHVRQKWSDFAFSVKNWWKSMVEKFTKH